MINDIIIILIGMTAMTVACAPGHYCPYGTVGANSFPCSSGKQWVSYTYMKERVMHLPALSHFDSNIKPYVLMYFPDNYVSMHIHYANITLLT